MGFRFRKSVRLFPGVRLNFSTRGTSLSVGRRGATVNFSKRGTRLTLGLPGTGLSYQTNLSNPSRSLTRSTSAAPRPGNSLPPVREVRATVSLDREYRLVFKDSDSGQLLPSQWIAKAKSQHAAAIRKLLDQAAENYNQSLQELVNVHATTPDPDQPLPTTMRPFLEPKPEPPKSPDSSWKTTFWPAEKARLEQNYQEALSEYRLALLDWEDAQRQYLELERQRIALQRGATQGITADMEALFAHRVSTLEWPRETLVDFAISPDGKTLALDVDLPEIEDLPAGEAKPGTDGLVVQPLSETRKRRHYAAHIHGILFRLIGEGFAALQRVEQITASGYSQRLSKATGHAEDQYLLSVRVTRDGWHRLNFSDLAQIDPVEALPLVASDTTRKMTKTGIFTPVAPLPPGFTTPPPTSEPPAPAPATPPINELVAGANTLFGITADRSTVPLTVLLVCEPVCSPGIEVDASAFLLDGRGSVMGDGGFVFYNQPRTSDGAVLLHRLNDQQNRWAFAIKLDRLPAVIDRIVFALTLETNNQSGGFGMLEKTWIGCTVSGDCNTRFRFTLSLAERCERALILGEIYRRAGEWKFKAVGQGFEGGLPALAGHYGVEVA